MSQTITLSAPVAMATVPALLALGGAIVAVAIRGKLTTVFEGVALIADHDDRAARWLHERGYRSTPEHPDVTGELLAVEPAPEPLAIGDVPHHDDEDAPSDDTERPYLWLLIAAGLAAGARAWLADRCRAVARGVGYVAEFVAYLFKSEAKREAEFAETFEEATRLELEAWQAANPPTNPQPYRGKHWVSDVQHTGAWPVVNVPAQRDGGDHDADR